MGVGGGVTTAAAGAGGELAGPVRLEIGDPLTKEGRDAGRDSGFGNLRACLHPLRDCEWGGGGERKKEGVVIRQWVSLLCDLRDLDDTHPPGVCPPALC